MIKLSIFKNFKNKYFKLFFNYFINYNYLFYKVKILSIQVNISNINSY